MTTPQATREAELISWLKYYENIDNIKHQLSVQYLFYDDTMYNSKTAYEVDILHPYERACEKCNDTFYLQGVYEGHGCVN